MFYLLTNRSEAASFAYLFCSHKMEQRLVKTRALPQIREGSAMIDVLIMLNRKDITNNFVGSLEDVDVNIPKQDWNVEEPLLGHFVSNGVTFSASEEHTLSYDPLAQTRLWEMFTNSLITLELSLCCLRETVETEHSSKDDLIWNLSTVMACCEDFAFLLRCKSFQRLVRNPAIVNAVLVRLCHPYLKVYNLSYTRIRLQRK